MSHIKVTNTESFIKKAKMIHGDKYDYSKAQYVNAHTKICIICPIHGEFWQTPNNHTHKTAPKGCPSCSGTKKLTTEEFITKARKIHGDKYDYSKVEYINNLTKVCIICPIHGEFWQTPNKHLSGCNCPFCSHQSFKDTKESFIEKARKIHGDKYDYSKVEYVDSHTKVCLTCPKHGEFWMVPTNHLCNKGCPKCKNELIATLNSSNTLEFITKARKIHGDKYDYSKVEYIKNNIKVCIICPQHGEFWQTPHSHLRGQGCPICNESHLENEIRMLLNNKKIEFKTQKRFEWLGRQSLDFYIPKYSIAIECQGEQHFVKIKMFNKKKTLKEIVSQDFKKNNLCKINNVKILYYTSPLIDSLAKEKPSFYKNNIFTSADDVIQKIRGTK